MKRKLLIDVIILFLIIIGFQILHSCKKLEKEMLVTTGEVTNILTNSADASGLVIDLGDGIIQHGHCYGRTPNVSVSGLKTQLGIPAGTGGFTSQLANLEAGTEYYIKAYISDGSNYVYGKEKSFTTVSPSVPTLTTTAVSSVTTTTATSGGDITSDGGAPVTSRGVCWSTSTGPTITSSKTSDGTGTGNFASSLTGLTANTKYYIRAYATSSAGTGYGEELSFTTSSLPAVIPTLSTVNLTSITQTATTSGGDIISDGGASIIAKGVCWSMTAAPTIADSKTLDGTGSGSFVSNITGLTSGTKYYVRAYATNSAGTAYGNELNFTTNALVSVVPTLSTSTITNISQTGAISGGNITNDGGASVTSRGVCWSTVTAPTISDSKTLDGNGTGIYVSSITGLTASIKYYVRAYAINSAGVAYGDELTFTTNGSVAVVPTLTTTGITGVTQTGAASGGNITNDGGASVTSRGVCWSTNSGPTISDSKTSDATGTGIFVSALTGLTAGTTYYVRAYAANSVGTAYGNELSFTTSVTAAVAPTVITSTITSITQTGATSGGNITSDGGASVTAKGVCWSTTTGPTISGSKTSDGTGTGVFVSTITGLTASTTYYVRAYATNSIETAYGNEVSFITTAVVPAVPTLTTTAISEITQTTATSGGNITSDGGASVTEKGVCWSTSSNPVATGNYWYSGFGMGSFVSFITGLTANTKYYVRAYATNSIGTAYGNELTFTTSSTVPGAPTIKTVTAGNAQATVTFTAPVSDGGSAITGYTATSNPGSKTGSGTASPITVTGLTNGTAYTFTVTATNANGIGPASSASNSVIPSTVPGAPTGVTAIAGDAQATITFTAPVSDGGSAITGYTVISSPGGSTGTGSSSPITVSGLTNGSTYSFQVLATNINGNSDLSYASNSVTLPTVPDAPIIGTAMAGNAQATITFSAPANDGGSAITGYTATSSPSGFIATGTTSPITVTGLTNGTAYTFTVTATNIIGTSSPSSASNFVTPAVSTVTNPTTGKIWMDRNLGASQVATSSTNAASYGDIYQWGRAADGHQIRTSGTTPILSDTDTPGHALFITPTTSPLDWRSPQNANLWQGVNGVNNPCPTGFRVPTDTEWEEEIASWSSPDAAGAYVSPLKLPKAGYRQINDGSLSAGGTSGYYWSSTVNGGTSGQLLFTSSSANMYINNRAIGFSVRCIKDY
jgi:uncharacterized protein (TIGR02145 family)